MKLNVPLWALAVFLPLLAFAPSGAACQGLSRTLPAPLSRQLTRTKFENVAAQLEFFDLRGFLYNRPYLEFIPADSSGRDPAPDDPSVAAHYFQLLNQVLDPKIPVAQIALLCHDPDPKVRTLALAAIFQRNDAHLLPLIVELTGDTAPTFPGYARLSQTWLRRTGGWPPPKEQTVGGVANTMANFYLGRAGFAYGVAGSYGNPGFAAYWAQRKGRKFCAGWFWVELARASRSTSPTQPKYRADIRAVRRHIDALPAADRDWTLLFLNGDEGSDLLATEAELTAAARRRGADALLSVLRDEIPSTDPDMQHRPDNDWLYQRLMGWILARAPELLRPDMADALLKCERRQRDYRAHKETDPLITAAWPVAAARLQPARGREILLAAWPRFQRENDGEERAALMAALTAVGDAHDFGFISTWLFSPLSVKPDGGFNGGRQSEFFRLLPHRGASKATRQLVARLIEDKGFDTAKFQAVDQAAVLVNGWSPAPIVDRQKLYETSGIGDWNDPKALAALEPVRAELRQVTAQWRQ